MNKTTAKPTNLAKQSFLEFGYCKLGFVCDLVFGICDFCNHLTNRWLQSDLLRARMRPHWLV